jgi:hypothetical protein
MLLLWLCLPAALVRGAQTITNVNIGTSANSGTGDQLRTAFQKLNANDNYLAGLVAANNVWMVGVSPRGLADGAALPNDGLPFGPDTPGTTTTGIEEAVNELMQVEEFGVVSGGGRIFLAPGVYNCTGQISIPNDYPFDLRIEGAGKAATMLVYSGSGSNDFVVTSRTTAAGQDASLQLTLKGMGFYYVADTNKVSVMHLMYVNEVHFEDCIFASYQALRKTTAGLVYRSWTPTNKLGIVGLRIEGNANNKMDFYHCSWFGLGVGAWIEADHSSFNDCFFGCIGAYSTNGTQAATAYGSLWKTTDSPVGFLLTNGPAIFSDGDLSSTFEMNVLNGQFFSLNCALIPNKNSIFVRAPLFEEVKYTSLADASVDPDAGRIVYFAQAPLPVVDRLVLADGTVSGTNGATLVTIGVPDGGHGDFLSVFYKDQQYLKLSLTNFFARGIFNGNGAGLTNVTPWLTNGGDIYYYGAGASASFLQRNNVAIGTNTPHAALEIAAAYGGGDGVPSALLLSTLDADTTVGITFHDTTMTNNWQAYSAGDGFNIGKTSVADFLKLNPAGDLIITTGRMIGNGVGITNVPSTSIVEQVSTKTADYTAGASDTFIRINGASKTITLPTAVGITGRTYLIKLVASGTTGTVATTSSQTIDGSTTYTLSAQYKYVQVVSNGAGWDITGQN